MHIWQHSSQAFFPKFEISHPKFMPLIERWFCTKLIIKHISWSEQFPNKINVILFGHIGRISEQNLNTHNSAIS